MNPTHASGEQKQAPAKKPYRSPKLEVVGDFGKMTLQGSGGGGGGYTP